MMMMMMEVKLIGNEGETFRQRIGCRIYATAEEERSNADGCQWGKQKWNVAKLYRSRVCVHRYHQSLALMSVTTVATYAWVK